MAWRLAVGEEVFNTYLPAYQLTNQPMNVGELYTYGTELGGAWTGEVYVIASCFSHCRGVFAV